MIVRLGSYKKGLLLGSIFIQLFKSLLVISEGLLIKRFFDNVTTNTDVSIKCLYAIVGVALIHILTMYISFRIMTRHNYFNTSMLRYNIFTKLISKHRNKYSKGAVQNSIRDDVSQIEATISWFITVISQFVLCVIAIAILSSIDLFITLLTFIPLIFIMFITRLYDLRIVSKRQISREKVGKINSFISSSLNSVLSIKTLGKLDFVSNEFERLEDDRNEALIKDSIFTTVLNSIYDNVNSIGTGIILILMAYSISSNRMSIGDYSVFIFYLAMVFDSIESLANFFVFSKQTTVSVDNILQKVEIEKSELFKPSAIDFFNYKSNRNHESSLENSTDINQLRAEELSIDFHDTDFSLNNISFTLKKNEKIAFCGKTGSGKSVLLEAICGFHDKMKGSISLHDYEGCKAPGNIFDYASFLEQNVSLFDYSISDNILMGKVLESNRLHKLLLLVDLNEEIKTFPKGLDTPVGNKGKKVSGGQKRRIGLARMLANDNQILIMDDFTSSLDNKTKIKIWNNIKAHYDDRMFILATNEYEVLKDMDYIYVIENGSISNQGTFDVLMNCDDFRSLL